MGFLERRRLLLASESLLPFVIWQNGMTSVEQIPVEYTLTKATLGITNNGLSVNGESGPGTKSVSFNIPAKYTKKAKKLNIVWYVQSAYSSCNVKVECDGQTLSSTGTANLQTITYTPDISALQGDMTVTFTGNNVRIYTLIVEATAPPSP